MTEEVKSVPVPAALRELIISSNQLLQNYQQELTSRVQIANREMMTMLGLNPQEGWALDITTMTYIKTELTNQEQIEQSIDE